MDCEKNDNNLQFRIFYLKFQNVLYTSKINSRLNFVLLSRNQENEKL